MTELMIEINNEHDVIAARKAGRNLAHELGFGLADQTRLATAISELTRNVVDYAEKGYCKINSQVASDRIIIDVLVVDKGPGISDLEQVLKGGYSSKGSLGTGLSGTKRLVNDFAITSCPGHTEIKISIERIFRG